MKKLITKLSKCVAIVSVCLLVAGCGDGFNSVKCLRTVEDKYGTHDVVPMEGKRYTFYVRTTNNVFLVVKTHSARTAEVTSEQIIFE